MNLFFEALIIGVLVTILAMLALRLAQRIGLLLPRQRRIRHKLLCVRPLDPDA